MVDKDYRGCKKAPAGFVCVLSDVHTGDCRTRPLRAGEWDFAAGARLAGYVDLANMPGTCPQCGEPWTAHKNFGGGVKCPPKTKGDTCAAS